MMNIISYMIEQFKDIATEKQGDFDVKEIVIINGKKV